MQHVHGTAVISISSKRSSASSLGSWPDLSFGWVDRSRWQTAYGWATVQQRCRLITTECINIQPNRDSYIEEEELKNWLETGLLQSLHYVLFSFLYNSLTPQAPPANRISPQHLPHVSSCVSQLLISCTPAEISLGPDTPRHPGGSERCCLPPQTQLSSVPPARFWTRAADTQLCPLWMWKGRRTQSPTDRGRRSQPCLDSATHQCSRDALTQLEALFLFWYLSLFLWAF